MNDKDLKINVSGGNVNIGSISQGNNNDVSIQSQNINTNIDENFSEFFQTINKLKTEQGISEQHLDSLITEVKSIREILEKDASNNSVMNEAKKLYEKYSWAADALKKLLSAIFI